MNKNLIAAVSVVVSWASVIAMPATTVAAKTLEPGQAVVTGAAALVEGGFAALAGKRVGLITNQTGRVGADHLADLLSTSGKTGKIRLTAIFAPEHGFRGAVEAGTAVRDGRDAKTGAPVFSLYGTTKKPTQEMLRDVDVLVFDIQDVGVRSYTYISTMGLAMQAAAARGIPFVVLDRPNPLGGDYSAGFVLEPAVRSFVGQYPIPIVHGLTVGELARMIKGERWLDGLDKLELSVIPMQGWRRSMRWPETKLGWLATSPNIPTFEAALVYPGIGLVGETQVNEGRGTPTPFSLFGAPWLDGARAAGQLNGLGLPGVRFEAASYSPRSIPDVAAHPMFEGQTLNGVRVRVTDVAAFQPVEVGIHALAVLQAESRTRNAALFGKLAMFNAVAGTTRLHRLLEQRRSGAEIIASWKGELERFRVLRAKYLMY